MMRSKGVGKQAVLILGLAAVAALVTTGWMWRQAGCASNALLPPLGELAVRPAAATAVVQTEQLSIEPRSFISDGGHVEAFDADAVLRGERGGACCVYEAGPFAAGDELRRLVVETGWIEQQTLAYKVYIADFGAGCWRASALVESGKAREIELPAVDGLFSSQGMLYVAVVAEAGTEFALKRIDCSFELAYGETASIQADLLDQEITGRPVAIPLTALDANGRTAPSFNETLTLAASNGDAAVSCEAVFRQGRARATVVLTDQGTYAFEITGAAAHLNSSLGAMSFYATGLPVYSIQVGDEALAALDDNARSDQYEKGLISIDGGPQREAKLRYRGGSRREAVKKSWKVKLCGDSEYADPGWGYKRDCFNLVADTKDSTMLREKLSYDMMQDLGVPAPRTRFVHLRVNDIFQGVYLDVENPRRRWLSAMGFNNDGSLYKAYQGSLEAYCRASEYETRFDKKTREDESFGDLVQLCQRIDELKYLDDEEAYRGLSELFDTKLLAKYYAALALVSSRENWIKNYYLYHDDHGTGKWVLFPWDMDTTWGYDGDAELAADQELDGYTHANELTALFFNNRKLLKEYQAALVDAVQHTFTEERLAKRIDGYYALICKDVIADSRKKALDQDYVLYLQAMKRYVKNRSVFIRSELDRLASAGPGDDDPDGAWARFGRGTGTGG